MPGYYQIMHYAQSVSNFQTIAPANWQQLNENTWLITHTKNQSVRLSYDVKAERAFVANSFVDSSHAYLVGSGIFLYIPNRMGDRVEITIEWNEQRSGIEEKNSIDANNRIATGLERVKGSPNKFSAPDFDILYDCPILIGQLEELPSFKVKGITHRFIGYKMGDFDRTAFMNNLQKVVEAASSIIGHIPYKEYTFIGIGPGRGGIEHLNNTTVSFDGKGLNTKEGMNRMMNFLAHEYFHHYNVKRIRPLELGPFDYDKGSRTNLLWVSEGLSVYYEYLIVRRAGLCDEEMLLADFEGNINNHENNPGKAFQSLTEASFRTWSDGPFGNQGKDAGHSISYYDKGPIVGLLLDFEIRQATQNKQSLDVVMQQLYRKYYQQLNRGFTDGEFQQTCEEVAGKPLTELFKFVYTTADIDYANYLTNAGLELKSEPTTNGKRKYTLSRVENPTVEQVNFLHKWQQGPER